MSTIKELLVENAGLFSATSDMGMNALGTLTALPTEWQGGKRKRLLAKDVIFHKSEQADRIYFVHRGLAKLLSHMPNGKSRIVRLYSKGTWIGLEALLGQSSEHTAIAIREMEVEYFCINTLRRFLRENPNALGQLLSQWHSDLVQADKWISDFSTGEIRHRVARLVLFLAELEYGKPADKVELLTVHEMADILGVTPESVSRHLAGFKRRAILTKLPGESSQEIYHLDSDKLDHEM